MNWEAWLSVAVVIGMLTALTRNWGPADMVIWFCLAVLVAAATLTGTDRLPSAADAVKGMGNAGLMTVGILFVVVEGLSRTGGSSFLSDPLLKMRNTRFGLIVPLMFATLGISFFLNNTAVVAMLLPVVHDIAKRSGTAPSKLFMPMCHVATLGGVCTLIGTSTNLVVDGMLQQAGFQGLGLFDLAWVGLPISICGVIYLIAIGQHLLPDRRPPISTATDPREYSVAMRVETAGGLVDKAIGEAGLRHLPGLYLAEVQRGGKILPAVSPHERLQADDILIFVGIVDSVVDLRRMRGLAPAENVRLGVGDQPGRCMIEAVVSSRCPLVGQSIREGDFRAVYDAVVLAVARAGERIAGKVGDIVLEPGDTLLLEAHPEFLRRHRHSSHFILVSGVENSEVPRRNKARLAMIILLMMIGSVALGTVDILPAALLAATAMLLGRCCNTTEARQSIDWSVLLVIGGAFGVADALDRSGAAAVLSQQIIGVAEGSPWSVLVAIYFASLVCTELVTNNAAAALMFPIAISSAATLGVSPYPFAIAVMIAASCGFATPFGYQTNMMVAGPGGYRFNDYVRVGLPLDFIAMAIAVALIPLVWPFHP